ncbi:MAG: hypothetical protein AAGJ46_14970 [Planctomycetota bacterium]
MEFAVGIVARLWRGVWLAGLLTLVASGVSFAEDASSTRLEGTSSEAAKEAARRSIPWGKLGPQDQRTARFLVRNHSVYRRLPTTSVRCEPEVFTFLAQRPEVVAGIWQLMGVSRLEVDRTSATTFDAVDHAGTRGALRVMHADWSDDDAQNRVVLFAEGLYEAAPLPRPIRAHSLLVLHSSSTTDHAGRPVVTARLDTFIRFERATADLIAKTLQPLIHRTADHNFVETMKFASTFSQTAKQNPDGLARLATKIEGIDQPTRDGLIRLCHATGERRR